MNRSCIKPITDPSTVTRNGTERDAAEDEVVAIFAAISIGEEVGPEAIAVSMVPEVVEVAISIEMMDRITLITMNRSSFRALPMDGINRPWEDL